MLSPSMIGSQPSRSLHAVEQRADAARPAIGHRPVAVDREREFLVLGADAELRLRLAARLEPRDEFVARVDRRHVDLVAGHAGVPAKKGRDLKHGRGERAMAGGDGRPNVSGVRPASVRLLEFQHELVHRHLGPENPLVARVLRVAQEIASGDELEAGRLDLAPERALLDPVQGLADRVPAPGLAEWSATIRNPPGLSAANSFLFIAARSTAM